MLSREDKAALIDMSMEAEELCYCKTIMEVIINLIKEKECRSEIMQFLYNHQGTTLRLFFEIMRCLPSMSNEQSISLRI